LLSLEDWIISSSCHIWSEYFINSLWVISFPFTRKRSEKRIRWGDVNNPVLWPLSLRMDARLAATRPLPFVPATRMVENFSWGLPRRLRMRRILVRPSLTP